MSGDYSTRFMSLLFRAMMVSHPEEIPPLTRAITHSKFQPVLSDRWKHIRFSLIPIITSKYSIEAPPGYKK